MLQLILAVTGRTLAALPEGALEAVCRGLGWLLATMPGRRRRTLHANLHHAFPEKDAAWRRRMAVESARRSLELGLFVLCAPAWSTERLKARFALHDKLKSLLEEYHANPQPVVVLSPHFSLMEANTIVPLLAPGLLPDIGVVYRPFDVPGIEAWVKQTRERWGLKLLSRKEGFFEAINTLRRSGAVVVLFDQNAGDRGALTLFCGRVCSTSELAGLLAEKCKARVAFMYPERRGFLHGVVCGEYLDVRPNLAEVIFGHNRWLENKLHESDEACADWLWLHSRWRHQDQPTRRFRLQSKRNLLDEQQRWLGLDALPKRTHFWVRMPNWLGDVVMALPLLRALRLSRPDAAITLLAQAPLAPLLEWLGAGDRVIALPPRGPGYFAFFRRLREEYPDTYLLLTNSWRGDWEARETGAPQRFGMLRPGRWRPWLTHVWPMPPEIDETREHQTRVWEKYFRHFGLEGELDFSPFAPDAAPARKKECGPVIGCICGTENSPEKRWPVEKWREMITAIIAKQPQARIELFGTTRDAEIVRAVAAGFAPEQVIDRSGKTTLVEFAQALRGCAALVCNDTGGMHLANALGVPVVAVYGPTNPVRTGPVFAAPRKILLPEGCSVTGGAPLHTLPAAMVFEALKPWLESRG